MPLVELSYDELETILIALVLRQDEIMSIPADERSDLTKYETEYIFDLSDRLNEIQRRLEDKMAIEMERLANNAVLGPRPGVLTRVMRFLGLEEVN